MVDVVLASANRAKLHELTALLDPLGVRLIAQVELGIAPMEETASTFIENAIDKARHAAAGSGLGAIADDSGLVVPAIGGRPGIYSARFAGAGGSARDNNRKLIAELSGVADRRAYYYCALVYLADAGDPAPVVATSSWHGEVIDEARGTSGFGYDPHFHVPGIGLTSAELDAATKNRLSHRGRASRHLLEAMRARL